MCGTYVQLYYKLVFKKKSFVLYVALGRPCWYHGKKSQNIFKYYKYPTLLDKIRGSHLGTWGTWWKPHGNMIRTQNKRSLPPSPSPKKKNYNWTTPHECMLSLLISCMKLLFPKLFVTVFGLRKHIWICEDESLRWFMRPNPNKVWEDESLRWIMRPNPNKVWEDESLRWIMRPNP